MKYLRQLIHKDKRLTLAYSSEIFSAALSSSSSLGLWECLAEPSYLDHEAGSRKRRQKRLRSHSLLQGQPSVTSGPYTRPNLLKVPHSQGHYSGTKTANPHVFGGRYSTETQPVFQNHTAIYYQRLERGGNGDSVLVTGSKLPRPTAQLVTTFNNMIVMFILKFPQRDFKGSHHKKNVKHVR